MRPGQGQRRGGRRNDNRHGDNRHGDNRHGENRHGGNGGQHRNHQGQGAQQGQQRSATSLRNQIFDSNGPDMRVRGNAFQVHEKYQALAKDALSSGDRVLAENYLQHAEHYYRIIEAINEATAAEQRARQASWESQPQPVQFQDGQPQSGQLQTGEQPQDGNQPSQEGAYSNQQDGQYQNQPQGNAQGNGEQNYRRREGQRDGQRGDGQRDGQQRDHRRDNQRDNRDHQRDNQRDNRDQYGRNQNRFGNPDQRGSENRNAENRNSDNRGNEANYDSSQQGEAQTQPYGQSQRPVEYEPRNQAQQPSGQSQDPLYDGVDEEVNDSPDTQAAVGGRR